MGANYSEAEVGRMVAYYAHIQAVADVDRKGMRFVVLAADLERALARLSRSEREAVVLIGFLGIPLRDAAPPLGTSKSSLSRLYIEAMRKLHLYINGGQ